MALILWLISFLFILTLLNLNMRQNKPPLKRYSQNFLNNPFYQQKIVDALGIQNEDIVVEIGPGQGALSKYICMAKPLKYSAIEIDQNLADLLKEKFGDQFELINKDFLDINISTLLLSGTPKLKVVSNLPYHITSPIIFKLIDQYHNIAQAVLMVQKEVARRITASNGNKDYGILSVTCQAYGRVEYLFEVKRGNFYPAPDVDSAVIRVTFNDSLQGVEDEALFRKIIRQTFNYRRKMLRNSLGRIFDKSIVYSLASHHLDRRPEELTVEEFKILSNDLFKILGQNHDQH